MSLATKFLAAIGIAITLLFGINAYSQNKKTKDDWIYVGTSSKNEGYYSESSVIREGQFVTVRTVMNVADWREFTNDNDPFKSFVSIFIIDCKNWTAVMGDNIEYSEKFGKGKKGKEIKFRKEEVAEDNIQPINKKNLLHKIALMVCEKK